MDPLQSQTGSSIPDPSHLEPMVPQNPLQAPQRHSTVAPDPLADPQGESQPEPPRDPQRHHATEPHSMDQDTTSISREERLELAYQELVAEGQKISGRTLARRAHMHRSYCNKWLNIRPRAQPTGEAKTPTPKEPDHKSSK